MPTKPEADVRRHSSVCLSDDARQYALAVEREHRNLLASADRSDLEVLTMLLIQQRAVDGLNGRRWDAVAHRYFEDSAMSIMERVKSQNALAPPFADRQKVDASRYDATNPKWRQMGICTVVGQRRSRCESGWMVSIMADDGTVLDLDSHWLSAANA